MITLLPRNRHVDIYVVMCWRCTREVELPATGEDPYRCPVCEVLLVIDWPGNGQASELET